MEQFLDEIREYASAQNLEPSTVVQKITGQSGLTWGRWVSGKTSPQYRTMLKIRAAIAANPAPEKQSAAAQ